jgi:hypothetical protein
MLLGYALTRAAAEIELGPRYIDPTHGFSLRPPAGADRSREFSTKRLVRWSVRDAKTGAIAWTLTVRKEPPPKAGVSLKAFAQELSAGLSAQSDVRVESSRCGRLVGKDALFLRTEHGQKTRRWQTEVWVLADETRFLVLSVGGPLGEKEHLEAAVREVAATLRLTDPKALAAARKENLARGLTLLKELKLEQLAAVAAEQPSWYLYRRGGQDVGFLYVAERIAPGQPAKGLEVRTVARLELKGGQVMHLRRLLFTTADRAKESWTETARVYRGGKSIHRMSEEGSRQGGMIVCKVASGGKTNTRRKEVPAVTAEHYLPRAIALLLPRLVKLSVPQAYAFAGYTTAANDFDMRTFTVLGPEKITLGAQTHEAVRVTDQMAADAEAATLYVQGDGKLLRMRTGVGLTMELSTPSAVLRRFPDAESIVKGQ